MPVGSFKLLTYIDLFLLKSAIVVNATRIFLGFVINRTMIFAIKIFAANFSVALGRFGRANPLLLSGRLKRSDEPLPVRSIMHNK